LEDSFRVWRMTSSRKEAGETESGAGGKRGGSECVRECVRDGDGDCERVRE
jgi:hypothetical protein